MLFNKILNILNKSKLLRYFSFYSVGRVVSVLISMLLLPLFTKKLSQSDFGVIGLLWLAVPLLSRLINLGMDVGVSLKYFKLNHKSLSLYLYHAIFGIALCGLLLWLFGFWRINWIQIIFEENMSRRVYSLIILSVISIIYKTMMLSFLILSGKAFLNVIFTLLPPIVVTATTYYLVIFINKSYVSYVEGMAIGNGIFGIIALLYFFRNYSIRHFHFSKKIAVNLLRIGLPVLPSTIATIILAAGDRYIIKSFIGLQAVAIYTYGYRFAEYILISIFQPFQKALGPVVLEKAAKNFEKASEYCNKIINYILIGFPLLIAFIIIPSKDIMIVLGNASYSQSYIIYLVALGGILLNNISQVYIILLNHLERTELSMTIGILGAAVNIGLNILLIPKYGIIAAAITTVFSYALMLILSIILINHFINNKIKPLHIILRLMPVFFYLFVFCYIQSISHNFLVWQIYILKVILFVIYVLINYSMFSEFRNYLYLLSSSIGMTKSII